MWKWVTVSRTLAIIYWQDETADLSFDLGFDWRVRNKQSSISYSNVSCVRMYGKLRLNAWQQAIKTILEYYQVAHQSRKSGSGFSSPCPRRVMQGHSFWLAVRLNTGLGVRFLYPTPDDCALGPLVQRFYWLANQSHVFRFRKGNWEIKSWFRRRKT